MKYSDIIDQAKKLETQIDDAKWGMWMLHPEPGFRNYSQMTEKHWKEYLTDIQKDRRYSVQVLYDNYLRLTEQLKDLRDIRIN
jgi:hypothetical protein